MIPAPPRRYAYRFGRCAACRQPLDFRRDNRTGQVEPLDEGTDRRHAHAPPIEVRLDEQALASAIVAASRALRAERSAPAPQPAPPPVTVPRMDEPTIAGVEVVGADASS